MGLDMYAMTIPVRDELPMIGFPKMPDGESPAALFYWRKHPNMHGWMERVYRARGGTGDFNLQAIRLTIEDIELLEDCIIRDHLPHTEGFFYGISARDEYQRQMDLEFVEKARNAIFSNLAVYYHAWW